jgi:hypothetical protein
MAAPPTASVFPALFVTACNHRRPGPQSSVGICPHSVRLSAGPNPQSVRPSPHCVRRTRNHRVGTEIRETENFASLPWRVRISAVFLAVDFQGSEWATGSRQPVPKSASDFLPCIIFPVIWQTCGQGVDVTQGSTVSGNVVQGR